MRREILFASLAVLVLMFSLCLEEKPVTEIVVGNITYTFSVDIHKSLLVPVEHEKEIRDLLLNSSYIEIVFNGTGKDNPYFASVGFNIASKLSIYRNQIGKPIEIKGVEIRNASSANTTILLLGPTTGARNCKVYLKNSHIIVVEGRTYPELVMAGDRLMLLLLKDYMR